MRVVTLRTAASRPLGAVAMAVQVCVLASAPTAFAGGSAESWEILKPSNTGIPGEEMRCLRFAPGGDIWVAARWPFWGEGGVGAYNRADQTWTVWSNWDSPIPSEFVNDVKFGSDGAVWIATSGGLVRKDGDDWTLYNAANSPLLHNTVGSISFESSGALWINNSDSQQAGQALFRLEGAPGSESWEMHTVPAIPLGQPQFALRGLFVDSHDHVWIASSVVNGAARYDGNSWSLVPGSTIDQFKRIFEDNDGNFWLIAGDLAYNFYKYDGHAFTTYNASNTPFVQTTVTTGAVDEDGTVYIGNWSGQIIRTTNGGATWSTYLSGLNIVFGIVPDPDSTDIWIRTIGAIGHFQNSGELVRDYNSYNTGLPWYWVEHFDLDPDGNLWLATNEAGLSRFDGERWRNWGDHNAGAEPYPFAGNEPMSTFYMDSTGTGWMGGNGIARWVPETGEFTGFWNWENNPGMGVGQWVAFAEDAAGILFSGEKNGSIFRFDPEVELWIFEMHVSANTGLPGMVADSKGNVWLAGRWDLYKWDGSSWTTIEQPYDEYFFDLGGMTDIAVDANDVIWLGTNDGLVRCDGETFTRYGADNSPLPFLQVWSIDFRDDGLMGIGNVQYAGADGGVVTVHGDIDDPHQWSIYPYGEAPLPHWQVGDVAFDAQGKLWISCLGEGVAILTTPIAPAAPGDLNGDGVVNVTDLLLLLGDWGACSDCGSCDADLVGDCTVDVADLLVLLANWG